MRISRKEHNRFIRKEKLRYLCRRKPGRSGPCAEPLVRRYTLVRACTQQEPSYPVVQRRMQIKRRELRRRKCEWVQVFR